ncbi:MAG: DUF4147 domain-containing protein [Acidimicrobiia bacterium]|nr:DUF4147 domain-containing protein [Acidimicrobiia bacterium]
MAVGKAAAPMARAFVETSPSAVRRVLVVGRAWDDAPRGLPVAWFAGRHPTPDETSVSAANAALALVRNADGGGRERVVLLLSGGASSMMAAPLAPVTLDDKQAVVGRLLQAGAAIDELNAVRKHLSRIKGGRLAAAARVPVLTLAVSDVVGDDLTVIGSGPTVADPSTYRMALDVLDRYGGTAAYPERAVGLLRDGADGRVPETPKPGDAALDRSQAMVIGGREDALQDAAAAARRLGYETHVLSRPIVGEARIAALSFLSDAGTYVRRGRRVCVVAGGETTVRVTGSGLGGRNQEFALALASAVARAEGTIAVASVGTDGRDGPTDAAGAIVDSSTMRRARDAGLAEPDAFLANNDSHAYFTQLGDTVVTGPTNTNVGDVQVLLAADPAMDGRAS